MYITVIETKFKTGNLIKIVFTKKTIHQIRFPVKGILSLEHFRSIFYHDLFFLRRKTASKVKKVKKLS